MARRVSTAEWWIRRMCRWIDVTRRTNRYSLSAVFPKLRLEAVQRRQKQLEGRLCGRISLRGSRRRYNCPT